LFGDATIVKYLSDQELVSQIITLHVTD